ncbi:hypothetical protein M2459_000956 [Parabacteroides sp. PF5-5]|uniref:hypothetical protein n=1 Tax=unclassified Parabacteroides TaxID=2649774 RepID=UPI0024735D3E|nr:MULTISPECIES: hypothetical protein [unclassified Parabacteroides]MDH6315057.1 hypothetical protein [Parabacteroides sp. PF5-13]MDH6326418.1 hypothetical protein [Parabacteroides sp. PH5-41]MDH6334218.1 hypothetical protein [Parabacteroides sp. PF5-5]MDH6345112.1 hypothetical protein [Parabacteroides sp. PH5-46]MDH6360239.1 hypothetical protein [Parabacteroides sp. PH5-16]
MAKRRILKKNIGYITGDLYTEVLVCKILLPDVDQEKVEQLLKRISEMYETFIRRAHHLDAKDNKVLVKKYYQKLFSDFEKDTDSIIEEIEAMRKEKSA